MLTVPKGQLSEFIDKPLEPSEWVLVDQLKINAFAESTLDHQFIHVDPEAAARTPFGGTIAHGYLTMSLVSHFLSQCGIGPDNIAMAINYGSDKVRFLAPVPVGGRVRGVAKLMSVADKAPGQLLQKTAITVEIEGEATPAMIAEILTLYVLK